jgi:hypothetical protein
MIIVDRVLAAGLTGANGDLSGDQRVQVLFLADGPIPPDVIETACRGKLSLLAEIIGAPARAQGAGHEAPAGAAADQRRSAVASKDTAEPLDPVVLGILIQNGRVAGLCSTAAPMRVDVLVYDLDDTKPDACASRRARQMGRGSLLQQPPPFVGRPLSTVSASMSAVWVDRAASCVNFLELRRSRAFRVRSCMANALPNRGKVLNLRGS